METIKEIEREIFEYLKEHEIFSEVYSEKGYLCVLIEWGDWKHDHMYADSLMDEKGYILCNEKVTDEDGSDCYSSIHMYAKTIK